MEKSTEQRKNQQLQQLLEAERENAEGGGGDDVTKVLQGLACNNTRGETFLYFEIS